MTDGVTVRDEMPLGRSRISPQFSGSANHLLWFDFTIYVSNISIFHHAIVDTLVDTRLAIYTLLQRYRLR